MQVLWSRTARTTSCRCTSCINSTTPLARRATTTAPKRRIKAGDVFTACYSAMFATAALADAKVKEDRRKRWDKAIAEAKAGTDAKSCNPPVPIVDRDNSVHKLSQEKQDGYDSSLNSIYLRTIRDCSPITPTRNGIDWIPAPQTVNTPLEKQLRLLHAHLRQSFAKDEDAAESFDELGIYLDQMEGPEPQRQTIEATGSREEGRPQQTEVIHTGQDRDIKTMEQLYWRQAEVAQLVSQLLLNTRAFSITKEGSATLTETTMVLKHKTKSTPHEDLPESLRSSERWRTLQAGTMGPTRLPQYTSTSQQDSWAEERDSLNKSIQSVLNHKDSRSFTVDMIIAKVCYNLLVSTAPPDIHTYNLMIERFTKLRLHNCAEIVLHTFFFRSKLRADQRTVVAALDHYAITKDTKQFRMMIRRMRAVEGDFRLQMRSNTYLDQPKVQQWALSCKVNSRKGALYQRVTRNGEIFESLIYGALDRFGLNAALRYFKAAAVERQVVSAQVFTTLAKQCLERHEDAEWYCIKLLRNLLCYWRQEAYTSNPVTENPYARNLLYLVMQRVGIERPSGSEQVGWLPSLQPVRYQPRATPEDFNTRELFNNLLRQCFIDSIQRKTQRIMTSVWKIKSELQECHTVLTRTRGTVMPINFNYAELNKSRESSSEVPELVPRQNPQEADLTIPEATTVAGGIGAPSSNEVALSFAEISAVPWRALPIRSNMPATLRNAKYTRQVSEGVLDTETIKGLHLAMEHRKPESHQFSLEMRYPNRSQKHLSLMT